MNFADLENETLELKSKQSILIKEVTELRRVVKIMFAAFGLIGVWMLLMTYYYFRLVGFM